MDTDYSICPEYWENLKPTKTGKYSNVDLTGMRFGKWVVLGPERCYGIAADENYLLICEYGCSGADPEIVIYKKR